MDLFIKTIKRIVIIVLIVVFLSFVVYIGFWTLFFIDSKRSKLIFREKNENKEYELIVYEIGSTFPYSPSNMKLELKYNNELVDTKEFIISNDGKALSKELNFKIEWTEDKVIVTAMGEEQDDEIIEIDYVE